MGFSDYDLIRKHLMKVFSDKKNSIHYWSLMGVFVFLFAFLWLIITGKYYYSLCLIIGLFIGMRLVRLIEFFIQEFRSNE